MCAVPNALTRPNERSSLVSMETGFTALSDLDTSEAFGLEAQDHDTPVPPLHAAPPSAPLTLYSGTVMHHRMKPKTHRFAYKVYSVLMDLDQQDAIGGLSPFLSHNAWNLFSVHDRDHGPADGGALRAWADRMLARAGLAKPAARILLLCYPRILGFVFNPLSVYYAYDEADRLVAVIYEVRNTFAERHAYVAKVDAGQLTPAGLRQGRDKLFFVSPFIDMAMRYTFNLKPPGDNVTIRILETDAQGPLLSATFHGKAQPVRSATLFAEALRVPFLTVKVVGAIHYEALRLWLKGIKLRSRPPAPPRFSLVDGHVGDGPPPAIARDNDTGQSQGPLTGGPT